jgi:hypothetical protein
MNQDKFSKYSDYLIAGAQKVVLDIAKLIVDLNKKIIKNPSNIIFERKVYEKKVEKIIKNFDKEWKIWADEDLAKAYIGGLKDAERSILASGNKLNKSGEISGKLLLRDFAPPPGIPEIPGQISMLFSSAGYANHETFFGVFRQSAYYSLEGQHVQLMRVANDIYRDIAIMAGENHYSEADIFTRRKFSQTMLNEFSRKGIQSITYKNGAKYSIDTYCEMLGRTLTGRCALQANINRMTESGYSLGIVSSHFRACDFCTPYEGVTLSMDGKAKEYESIWDAELQGLWHPNCAHEVSPFFEDVGNILPSSIDPYEQELVDQYGYSEAQKMSYAAQQKQRYIERNIRNWKRREVISLDSNTKDYSNKKVREWQAKQRDHLNNNKYLRRKYEREGIKKAH